MDINGRVRNKKSAGVSQNGRETGLPPCFRGHTWSGFGIHSETTQNPGGPKQSPPGGHSVVIISLKLAIHHISQDPFYVSYTLSFLFLSLFGARAH